MGTVNGAAEHVNEQTGSSTQTRERDLGYAVPGDRTAHSKLLD